MQVVCPSCGTPGQEAGKYCENCGYLIPESAGQAAPDAQAAPDSVPAVTASAGAGAAQAATPGVTVTGPTSPPGVVPGSDTASAQVIGAQFAVVRDGQANLNEGFTITRPGEFLVGRMDQESGHQVDVDLRQWVQPID